ncbi:uncharacterized protein NECHADRAFT_88282 [Fusarium vanettenii 77-13-4]|uniref:NACHT domain-containing protein n=1 Tax=Fusarium vanettenii (strain ATCC MYA-4622 / CBS 123669 / FGSC 9596 / NRRL 45880 / 77-13-4) TaxID=660122 RepID=C7ZE14_FUSV7|nr:uncharacterized protein NECHADRAFT_88282 [Fusarium vanettenii 77-13-4]EEU37940.1 predicted protein [Fusarium vanettenii 77-13-4]
MSDPGTCLAIVSLALQVSKGLLGYYDLWTHADEDVAEIQRSLLALANIFTQLEITLEKPNLSEDIISIVRITMKGCDSNVKKLEEMLEKFKREGDPEKLRTKFKNFNRRMLRIFYQGEIMRVQSVLSELREDLHMVVGLLSLLNDLRKVHADLTTLQNSNKERIEMEKEKNREARRCALIEWLAAPDISAAHLSAQDQREEGTGEWFLESQEFLEWANTGRSMWLAGDVGCGKTVLCSSVIEELKSRAPQRGDRIAYFYFTFSDTDRHGIAGFLKSVLRQLCLAHSVDTLMEALHQRCGLDPPSTKQMQATLLAYLERVCASGTDADVTQASQVYMVLDGLDEIPYGPDRTTLLLLLNQMAERAYPLLHILVSSRPERHIEKEILGSQHWRTFPFSSGGARNDMEIYVTNQIKLTPRLASLPDHIKHKIHETLVAGAGGMFRLTALQMQELKMKRILRDCDVQNILSSLPKSLDATYERVLLQIDSEVVYEAKTALQWLCCCIRPLYLEELVDASIIKPDEEVPFSEDHRIKDFGLLDLLPGLVKVNPPPDLTEAMFQPKHYTVTLAHFSVKEYLVSSRTLDSLSHTYAINLDLAHRHIVRSSLAYIGHCLSVGSSYPHHEHGVVRFPLQMYAYSRWEMHAKLVSGHLDQVWACVLKTFRKPTAALMWCWLSRKLREEGTAYHFDIPFQAFLSPDWPTNYLLCRAIGSGIEPLVRAVLDSTWLNLTGQLVLGNPFSLALISRSGSCPRNILQGSSNSLSAGSISSPGDDSLPRMLLESGYQPTARDLLLSVRHGTAGLLSLMIERAQNFLFSDLMEGMDQAVTSRRLQVARIFLRQLLSGTHSHPDQAFCTRDDAKKAVFDILLAHAVEKDSPRLIAFLIDSLPDGLFGQLDFDSLFLRAVVDGRCHAAAAIRRNQSTQISEKTVSHMERWQSVMPRDELCFALLNLFASRCHTTKPQPRTRKTRKKIARDLIKPYALGLDEEMVDQVLQVWSRLSSRFEPLRRQGPVRHDIPLKVAMSSSTLALAGRMSLRLVCESHGKARETLPVCHWLNTEMNHATFFFKFSPSSDGRGIKNYTLISGFNLGTGAWCDQPCLMSVQVAELEVNVITISFSTKSFKLASLWRSAARKLFEQEPYALLSDTWDSFVEEASNEGTFVLARKQYPVESLCRYLIRYAA